MATKKTTTTNTTTHTDVYQIVTDRILAEMDKGIVPWRKPWTGLHVTWTGRKTHTETRTLQLAYSRATGKPYSLMNQMLLGKPGEWASFKQIQEAGGKVRKGEKASPCVFWKFIEVEQKDADGKPILDSNGKPLTERIPMLRYYSVFHVETQCENITPKTRRTDPCTQTVVVVDDPGTCTTKTDAEWADIEEADEIIRSYVSRSGIGYTEEPGSDSAYYSPMTDSVTVPCRAQFKERAEFYSATFHELVHSTGHQSRLNRLNTTGNQSFGSEEYSKEELVAEIGSACINNTLGIETPSSFRNSAAYIAGWARKLREDRKMIVSAASRAEKAVNYIFGANDEPDTDEQ